ncbi:MAG: LysR family transcriptional regulator [Clostridiales bacterium]|nr:LysR family transcriptional regulator [Clostridiales bacterium]
MQLLWLQYFVTVAKCESIVQAARIHEIPQPAMSITMKKLESELGTMLFDRLGNRLRLNESGQRFLEYAERSLHTLSDGVAAVTEERNSPSGNVRILLLDSRSVIIDRIDAFRQRYPKITFTLYTTLSPISDFEYDLCIAAENPLPHMMDRQSALIDEEILIAMTRDHHLADKQAIGLNELRHERLAMFPRHTSLAALCADACSAQGLALQPDFVCDDPFYIRRYVERGDGVTFAPAVSWQGLFSNTIRLLHVRGVDLHRTIYVHWSKDKFLPFAARAFLQDLRDMHLY